METQPELPLDERFRAAEQYALDLGEPPQPKPQPKPDYFVCPSHCPTCPRCREGR